MLACLLLWDEGMIGPEDGRGVGWDGRREARCKNVTTIMFILATCVLSLDLEPLLVLSYSLCLGRRGGCLWQKRNSSGS